MCVIEYSMTRCESQSKRTTKLVVKSRSVFLALRLFAARKSRKKIYFVFGSLKWQELWNNETDFAAVRCDDVSRGRTRR